MLVRRYTRVYIGICVFICVHKRCLCDDIHVYVCIRGFSRIHQRCLCDGTHVCKLAFVNLFVCTNDVYVTIYTCILVCVNSVTKQTMLVWWCICVYIGICVCIRVNTWFLRDNIHVYMCVRVFFRLDERYFWDVGHVCICMRVYVYICVGLQSSYIEIEYIVTLIWVNIRYALCLQVIFRKRALSLVALLRKMTCNLTSSIFNLQGAPCNVYMKMIIYD